MSAKWRALQHRHRYTYTTLILPPPFLLSLSHININNDSNNLLLTNFYSELNQLVNLTSMYAQLNHVKNVSSSFYNLLLGSTDEGSIRLAVKLYLELLFLENSLPLHRTLLSVLTKIRKFWGLLAGCFRSLCNEYGGEVGKRFCVSRVALSMMSTPKLGYLVDVVEECCVLVAFDVVYGLRVVVEETNGWARPSPLVMEQCQEGLSCLYYLLQRFPCKFVDVGGLVSKEDSSLIEMVVVVILCVLKSASFSRDCFVAAAVSFCAALQVLLSTQELGFLIWEGVFERKGCCYVGSLDNEYENAVAKVPYKGDFSFEIQNFPPLSRLCLIRGILTAVPRTLLNAHFVGVEDGLNVESKMQSILYDAILPELCKYCENPTDSHFNFHALTVMQICLQQIKTSLLAESVDWSADFSPIPEDLGARIIRIIWNNLEDPLSQTVKQVHLIFDLFLDIKATLHQGDDGVVMKSFLQKIAGDLLRLGSRCKGRYIPLASLTKRLGAKNVLGMSPNLLFETMEAYIDDDVCCAATSFLKCFLECLRDECWSRDGVERGYEMYRSLCLPPFLLGLASGVSKLRSNLNTYALTSLLDVDVDSIFTMLSFISVGVKVENEFGYHEASGLNVTLDVEQKVAVLVSLLKVSRSLALFEGDIDSSQTSVVPREKHDSKEELALIQIKGFQVEIPVEWLAMALAHVDDSLRVDAAELLFLNPKTASLPSSLELNLMRIAVPLNMRCCSTAFQMKWSSLFRKFFARVRTALERQIKQGVWQPSNFRQNCKASVCESSVDIDVSRAGELYQFMRWLSYFLFFSCYPSAPYERKIMAMELLIIMMSVWSIVPLLQPEHRSICSEDLYPYGDGLIRRDSTLLLVGSIVDSWDKLRENAFRILLSFPTPLPGISSEDMVQKIILWGKKLVCSPRVRESDAGALTLRLLFRKYVVDLGWVVKASTAVTLHKSESELSNGEYQASKSRYPIIEYINSLIDWLEAVVEEGEKDLLEACKNSFVHGVLLALRYTFEELEWNADIVTSNISDMRCALGKLLELVMRITSLALWVVSADAWYLPRDTEDFDEDSLLMEVQDDVGMDMQQHDAQGSKVGQDTRPTEQIVMVGCWLAMKEVSLLLGTIIRKIPLPTATFSVGYGSYGAANETADAANGTSGVAFSDSVLDVNQLEVIGNHFLEVLLKMKHNGAIDKTRAGFTALCNRLLCSDDPRLCKLTESWMEQLMDRTVAKGQTVDDLLRRSAGIPAAFSAFFLSEPQGAPKKLLPRALRWLIDVANGSLLDQTEPCSTVGHLDNDVAALSDMGNECMQISDSNSNTSASKVRDEGVIPTVHAFNVLKAAFNDANLATDTSGFSAEAMIISIGSFSSPHWEIRNSACLAYTALVRRMVGFLNVHKRESARRAITSLEFFHRYPALHSFVFKQLKVATEMLLDGKSKSQLASIVHPSLCPVLILLSRLKPSPIASEKGDHLDPFLFMPFIQRCSMQRNMRVRVLASRALTSMVSNEKLRTVLLDIVSGLPCSRNETETDADISCQCTNFGHVSYNSIHGILLQLSALLNANCQNLADFASKDLILDDLIKALKERSWIGSPSFCPCPILNTSFLRVLDRMLSIAGSRHASKNYDVISSLLSELSSECLALKSPAGTSFHDPTAAELRKQAAMSYFRCIYLFADHAEEVLPVPSLSSSADTQLEDPSVKNVSTDIEGRLISYMSDMSYEVRHATFKWLFRFVRAATVELGSDHKTSEVTAIISWAKANLQTTLMALLSVETHHKCVYYILRIIFAWNLLQFKKASGEIPGEIIYIGGMDIESILQFWNKLVSIHEISSHSKTLEALVCCLGLCIKRFSILLKEFRLSDSTVSRMANFSKPEELTRCNHLYERIRHFVCLIKEYSDASQPVNLRKAAAEAVVASGLLEQAEFASSNVINSSIPSEDLQSHLILNDSFMFAHQILEIWFTCIKLLEDEDVSIRKEIALDIQRCFPLHYRSHFDDAGIVPSQVEKVIELSFEFLSSVFGHWDRYFDYLLRWVFDAASYAVPNGDLVRRVFDKEIDNHHEEKLLICQICCSHLETLQVSKIQQPEFHKLLREWRSKFLNQLNTFANDYVEKLGATDWIGGIGNHKDAFLPLYGNLLGLHALSKWFLKTGAENGTSMLSDIVELGKSIRPFLKNPLVCNLFMLLVRLHGEMVGETAELYPQVQEVGHIWDGFHPFFLLR